MPECEKASTDVPEYRDPIPFHVEAQGLTLGFYPAGPDRLERLLRLIGEAQHTLDIAFYIFARDASGIAVRDALVAAAGRGVAVTIILDGFGAVADAQFFAPLVAAGGTYHSFLAKPTRRYLIRNHQKIVIADKAKAMLGGFNIEDSYFDPPEKNGWNDLAFTVTGEVVEQLAQWFAQMTILAATEKGQFGAIRKAVREWRGGKGAVQLLIGGPMTGLSSWARCVSHDLQEGERLDMMMAYFSPPHRLRKLIEQIARKGHTRLVMAGKSDNGATIGASRALYRELLEAGANIWEFQPCKLHTKLIVLDDAVYLGSANFDMRSLYLNMEIMLRIEDAHLADVMRQFIVRHLDASQEITPQLHRRNSTLFNRIRWTLSWFLVSVVDYTVSRKLNLGLSGESP
ncbi:hypothetical protein GCM10009127_06080 [Alteraurantiacibacter aestuarii]|uniref:Phospholipase D n=1 Tax=Alteraurantiacibacter aestuarii TaxID=650004 RepID=A0A844ZPW0_9SPHN|nr:cardiolipin synthase B [Alteraurantiacibacter aestuarii]MXO89086.1 cardiolipin synthase B [Alteraurantiacibacter aestuarii]